MKSWRHNLRLCYPLAGIQIWAQLLRRFAGSSSVITIRSVSVIIGVWRIWYVYLDFDVILLYDAETTTCKINVSAKTTARNTIIT